MIFGIWAWVATPAASLIAAVLAVIWLILCGFHRNSEGGIYGRRLGIVVGLSASSYTFTICVLSQLLIKGPSVGKLVEHGFGSERIAWLLLILLLDQVWRLWDEYRPHL
jgi:hypothetical protein